MIASIAPPLTLAETYRLFLKALSASGFRGEISATYADRTVMSTDNSIYQRMPQAVVFPKDAEDVVRVARLTDSPSWRRIVLCPRGGGTGTNGQSLTDGIVVDLSRHMNRILSIDPVARRVRVEAGVVKDQLNAALRPYGLFFAPELSTSNRATIGGMIATDASGQGSCTYGKTRDHVLALDAVYLGGERHESRAVGPAELQPLLERPGRVGDAWRCAHRIVSDHARLIEQRFPKLNRCLTGYDLAHLCENGRLNLNSVLCGAEGSLAFVVEAELNVLPIPAYSVLVNVRYASFMDALRDAQALMALEPLSIETVDSRVLLLAMDDMVWQSVARYFPGEGDALPTRGINMVEFSGAGAAEVDAQVRDFLAHLRADTGVKRLGHTLAEGHEAVRTVYRMRKRAVGLLGNAPGEARPQPFVEDTAVPPENLAAYIAEFRAVLDGHGLSYGMFGHVDAGVLHVRPALDMKDPAQAALIRPISDAVAALTQKYGGVLWGEHGKGVRSEYAPSFFGPLYPQLQALKAAFDPYNQLNPGKIATPSASTGELLRIDEVPMRGQADRQIDERVWQSYTSAVHCNGNGACYNFDPDDAMCPSWKGTRDRRHSPKGRASLMREWLRLQGEAGVDVLQMAAQRSSFLASLPSRWRNSRASKAGRAGLAGAGAENGASARSGNRLPAHASHAGVRPGPDDFSHEVYEAMAGCLACKACAGQCPVKVSVPEFRARFLELYHARYLRPLKDYLIGSVEHTVPWFARWPGLYNRMIGARLVTGLLARHAGMVDSPLLSRFDLAPVLRRWRVDVATPAALAALSPAARERSVVLVQDAFTRHFETPVFAAFVELAARLGYTVWLAPFRPNGKPLQVQGFLQAFERAAQRNAAMLAALADSGIPLVGLDPAMTLVYRQEYAKVAGLGRLPEVLLAQEWLVRAFAGRPPAQTARAFALLAHCTEKTNAPAATALWPEVFRLAGASLTARASGCCGMSGTYGHETRNVGTSQVIFDTSWGPILDACRTGGPDGADKSNDPGDAGHADAASARDTELVATGYSCRSQVKRWRGVRLRHPVEVLLELVTAQTGGAHAP